MFNFKKISCASLFESGNRDVFMAVPKRPGTETERLGGGGSAERLSDGEVPLADELVDQVEETREAFTGAELRRCFDSLVSSVAESDPEDRACSRVLFGAAFFLVHTIHSLLNSDNPDCIEGEERYVLEDLAHELEEFLALNVGYHPRQQRGHEFLKEALAYADELVVALNGSDAVDDRSSLSLVKSLRRHPSRFLARALMQRVNEGVDDPGRHFLTGEPLREAIEMEMRELLCPEMPGAQPTTAFLLRQWLWQRKSYRSGIFREKDLALLDSVDVEMLKEDLIVGLDRFGSLRPSLCKDLAEFIFSGATQRANLAQGLTGTSPLDLIRQEVQDEWIDSQYRIIEGLKAQSLKSEKADLPNERAFDQDVARLLFPSQSRGEGHERRYAHLRVLMMDLNGFKPVNDDAQPVNISDPVTGEGMTYSKYALGDKVLYLAGEAMKSVLRHNQMLYHWHGDEFALLLPEDMTAEAVYARLVPDLQEVLHQLAVRLNMCKADGTFIDLGMAAGVEIFSPERFLDAETMKKHIANLMGQNKKDSDGVMRTFGEKCGVVLGESFRGGSGRYDRTGVRIEDALVPKLTA